MIGAIAMTLIGVGALGIFAGLWWGYWLSIRLDQDHPPGWFQRRRTRRRTRRERRRTYRRFIETGVIEQRNPKRVEVTW